MEAYLGSIVFLDVWPQRIQISFYDIGKETTRNQHRPAAQRQLTLHGDPQSPLSCHPILP